MSRDKSRRSSRDVSNKSSFTSYDVYVGNMFKNRYYSTEVGQSNANSAMHEAGARKNEPAFAVNRQTGEVEMTREITVRNASDNFEGALTK